jgi:REP element-mobilizing transposase RayT
MARTLRNDPAGAWHHVMNRGARHQPIYLDDRDRHSFLGLLDDLYRDDGIETHAYCLMGNHYHLILSCPDGNLSTGMHHLGSSHAQRFNRRHGFDGPLFRGRFLSKPIETDEYLLQASRYVHRNPLDLDATIDLVRYPWSSYPAYLGHRRPQRWLHRSMVLGLVGGDASTYQSQVESEPTTDAEPTAALEAAVAAAARRAAPGLLRGRGCNTILRNLTLVLAVDDRHASVEELARHFGMASTSSAWSAVHRTRARVAADPAMAAVLGICRIEPGWSEPNEHIGA